MDQMDREFSARRIAASLAFAAMLWSVAASPPAFATEPSGTPDAIADQVEAAASVAATTPIDGTLSGDEDVAVSLPTNPADDIRLIPADGPSLEVSLPENVDLSRGVTTDGGTVVFEGREGNPDVAVQQLPDGARVSAVIDQRTSIRSFEYPLPDGVVAQAQSDGRIELTKSVDVEIDGSAAAVSAVVGYMQPAWALDASGKDVETSYEIGDGIVTQHVTTDANTTYPVVADPQWTTTSWNQIRIRWNRAETATIAGGGWGATGAAAVCMAAGTAIGGPAGAAALGAACLGVTGSAVYTAGVAQNSRPKRCLEMYATFIPITPPTWVPWFATYTGGNCR